MSIKKLLPVALVGAVATTLGLSLVPSGQPPAEALDTSCERKICAFRESTYQTNDGIRVTAERPAKIANSPIASFPSVFVDGSRVWVSYSKSEDLPGEPTHFQTMLSTDSGQTFTRYPTEVSVENAIVGPAGQIAFAEAAVTYPDRMTARITGWQGGSWTPFTGKLSFRTQPKTGGGATFNHGIVKSGSELLAPYYGRFSGDVNGEKTNRVEIASSTDGGFTWQTVGTVFKPRLVNGKVVTYSESSLVRLDGGKLMLIARNELFTRDGHRVSYRPLAYAISRDGGRTWGPERTLLINGKKAVFGGRPSVIRMGNGAYVLAVGRLDNVLAFAKRTRADGSPSWSGKLLAYRNYPEEPVDGYVYRVSGSSGYPAVAALSSSRLISVFDNCAATWGCNPPKTGFTVSDENKIVRRFVTVRTTR